MKNTPQNTFKNHKHKGDENLHALLMLTGSLGVIVASFGVTFNLIPTPMCYLIALPSCLIFGTAVMLNK